ncbi:transglycosylase SLT domain-containing protein [Nocardia sp. XZ_19_385]|uniref:transglycosylase SLT domain-containing protein n=1 Tax=Nocardia sp. XZ_19_385 TaxID=2769488 RepID=UPI00188FD57E|nr:transglycosylase SLT domain-containing protein [Nocardia sp. XZ_19_385]
MKLSSIRRKNLREGVTFAVAAAGIVAVAASSAVSVADDSVPSRVAMISEAKPAQTAVAAAAPAAKAEAPVVEKAAAAAPAPAPAAADYPDNLDGWIREALDIMKANNIPGSYEGIYRNIIRESAGNPAAINLWDSNAAMGIPSKGLLQTIDPTFQAYHVAGTPHDVWDPVANIVAACNYAAHRYGSMDNVNSAY